MQENKKVVLQKTIWKNKINFSYIREGSQKKTTKFKTYAKSLDPYLPCTLIWTEKSLDIFFTLWPTYLFRKFGQIWKKVCTLIMAFRQKHMSNFRPKPVCQSPLLALWRGWVLGTKSKCLFLSFFLLTEVQRII